MGSDSLLQGTLPSQESNPVSCIADSLLSEPWRKPTNLDESRQHIEKQRHHFANKGLYSQSYGFSSTQIWMWELDHKGEHQRIDTIQLWCWRRLSRNPWPTRRSNQYILKEINPEYLMEGLIQKLQLKLQFFGHLMQRANSLEKTLMLGKIKGRKKRGWQNRDSWMASSTQWAWVWANSRRWWRTGKPGILQSMGSQRISHWTTTNIP